MKVTERFSEVMSMFEQIAPELMIMSLAVILSSIAIIFIRKRREEEAMELEQAYHMELNRVKSQLCAVQNKLETAFNESERETGQYLNVN